MTLVGWLPLLSAVLANVVGDALGCDPTWNTRPCPGPFGWDLGPLLYDMDQMKWFLQFTWLAILATLVLWATLLVRALIRRVSNLRRGRRHGT